MSELKVLGDLLLKGIITKKQYAEGKKKLQSKVQKPKPKSKSKLPKKKRPARVSVPKRVKIRNYRENLANDGANAARGLVSLRYKFDDKDVRDLGYWIDSQNRAGRRVLITYYLNNGERKTLAISINSIREVGELLKNSYFTRKTVQGLTKSDAFEELETLGFYDVEIRSLAPPKKLFKKSGNFFNYVNTTDLDLTRYQIVQEKQIDDDLIINDQKYGRILNHQCLLFAFMQAGLDDKYIESMKLALQSGHHISKSQLPTIADIMKITIRLHEYEINPETNIKRQRVRNYGNYDEVIDIALHSDHFFIYEQTKYTSYAIRHYNEVKDIDNFESIVKVRSYAEDYTGERWGEGQYVRNNKRVIDSLQLIELLFNGGHFSYNSFELMEHAEFKNPNKDEYDISLDNIHCEQNITKLQEKKENLNKPKEIDNTSYFFADTESLVNKNPHRGFMCGVMKLEDNHPKIFMSTKAKPNKWLIDMLFYVTKNVKQLEDGKKGEAVIFYHNLKYDFHLFKGLLRYAEAPIEKDGQLYEVRGFFNGVKLYFRDSYKLIPEKLSKFADMFSLPDDLNKKEAIGYSYYTEDNIYESKANVDEYLKHVHNTIEDFKKIDNKRKFRANLLMKDEFGDSLFKYDSESNTFDHIAYYRYYLKYDVLVLKEGLKVFDEKIKKICELTVFDALTISSLTHNYMVKEGAYDGVYSVCGLLREFISKAIYGGRVALLESQQKKVIDQQLVDYDSVSLYPTAIYRMCQEMGIPKGQAKRIKADTNLESVDYYVVKIKITKINKKQQIPFIAYRHDDRLDYINEVPEGGLTCIVDKITLEDYIEFHKIEYDLLDGVYWDEGFNKKFGELIENLFKKRVEEKNLMKKYKESDPLKAGGHDCMQQIIKLMLNSAYGKTIIKKSKTSKVIVNRTKKGSDEQDDDLHQYIYNNFHTIKEVNELTDYQSEIIHIDVDVSYNLAHVGCMVLSYSKRIMNEVMNLANDNGILIYYQDTDSMHMKRSDVEKLKELYMKTYSKVLDGSYMGQFHSDFSLKGSGKGQEVYAILSIFLGKKCYIDVLESHDDEGKKINGYHIRMKGVNQNALIHRCETDFNGNYANMYEALANGEKLDFILNVDNKALFKYTKSGNVKTRELEFVRTISF